MHQTCLLAFREISTGWRNEPTAISYCSTKENEVLPLGWNNPRQKLYRLAEKQLCRKRLVGSGGQLVDHESIMCPSNKESQQHSGLHWKERESQGRSFFSPGLLVFMCVHIFFSHLTNCLYSISFTFLGCLSR